jgi:hypothetical protein
MMRYNYLSNSSETSLNESLIRSVRSPIAAYLYLVKNLGRDVSDSLVMDFKRRNSIDYEMDCIEDLRNTTLSRE